MQYRQDMVALGDKKVTEQATNRFRGGKGSESGLGGISKFCCNRQKARKCPPFGNSEECMKS